MNSPAKWLVSVAMTLSLSACSLLAGKRESLTVYAPRLAHTATVSPLPAAPRHWQLWVAPPAALEPLTGTRIAVVQPPGTVQFYKGVRWRDDVPAMLLQLIIDGLREFAGLAGVGTPASGLHADYVLQSDLSDFQIEFRGAPTPTAVLRITLQLVEASSGQVLALERIVEEEPCADAQPSNVFAAFQTIVNRGVLRIAQWTAATGDAHWHAEASSE